MDNIQEKNTEATRMPNRNMTVLNRDTNFNLRTEQIFGDNGLPIQRFDKMKYPNLFRFYHDQKNAFWSPDEIDIVVDKRDYANLRDEEKFIFTSNLKYQILLDSVQLRGIDLLMSKLQNTQVEAFCAIWKFFEQIHSISYSHIIQNLYANPAEIFDNITNDTAIMERSFSVVEQYNTFLKKVEKTQNADKKIIFLTLISIYLLESIRFYVSFACSYSFAQKGVMSGNAKIIQLINKDEIIHFHFTRELINILRKEESEGFTEIIKELKVQVEALFDETVQDECKFIKYLFDGRRLDNLSPAQLKAYVKFLANKRGEDIGYPDLYPHYKENPLPWINTYTNSGIEQVAPQEMDIISYNIAGTTNDLETTTFDFDFS